MRTIGAQMYTVRDFCKSAKDVDETVAKLKKIGYTYGQASGFSPDITGEEIAEVVKKHDFPIVSSHNNFNEMYADIDKAIKKFKTYGDTMPGVGGFFEEARKSVEGIKDYMTKANEIASRFAAEGLTFTYHNHSFEWAKLPDGSYIFDRIMEYANDDFKLMVDVYWLTVAGLDPIKFLKDYKDKIGAVHFKDLKMDIVNFQTPLICEVMEGNLNWEGIFKTCDEINPRYIFVEQDTNWKDGDPFKSLEISYNNLKKHGYR